MGLQEQIVACFGTMGPTPFQFSVYLYKIPNDDQRRRSKRERGGAGRLVEGRREKTKEEQRRIPPTWGTQCVVLTETHFSMRS